MRKINLFLVGIAMLFMSSNINATVGGGCSVWEIFQTGFLKYYYQSYYGCDDNDEGWSYKGGKDYYNCPFYVEEYYKGLPSNSINSMTKDSEGNFYFGYTDYLVKHNPAENYWTIYNEANSSFKGKVTYDEANIVALKIDANDNIWAATHENGLMKFDGKDFTYYNTENSDIPSNWISDIEVGADGNIYLVMPGNGVAKFDGTSWTPYNEDNTNYPETALNKEHISMSIAIDGNNRIWVGNGSKLEGEIALTMFNGTSWTSYSESEENKIKNDIDDITTDKNGNIWLAYGMYGGLSMIDITEDTIADYSDDDFGSYIYGLKRLASDNDSSIYVGSDVGLTKVNIFTRKMKNYTHNNSYIPFIDEDDKVFFKQGDGIYTIEADAKSLIYTTANNEMRPYNSNLQFDDNGKLWGLVFGGIQGYDGLNWNFIESPDFAQFTGSFSSFVIDSKKNIWASYKYNTYFKSVAKYDGSTWTELENVPFSPKGMTVDKNDNIWIASWGK